MMEDLRLLELALTHRVMKAGPLSQAEYCDWKARIIAASGGRNALLMDDEGFPSVMLRFEPPQGADLLDGADKALHPAFVAGGKTLGSLWLAKYPCCRILHAGREHFLSLRGTDSAQHIGYDRAVEACGQKGAGWHMMTNVEYAFLALLCRKNGFEPHGNTCYGTYALNSAETGAVVDFYAYNPLKPGRLLTGSGPANWAHDATDAGMYELNGNVWEWAAGLRMVDGEIQILPDNDAALPGADLSEMSRSWRAISPSGELLIPQSGAPTPGAVGFCWNSDCQRWEMGARFQAEGDKQNCAFQDVFAQGEISNLHFFQRLGLLPPGREWRQDCFFACGSGERLAARGGSYIRGETSGIFALLLTDGRDRTDSDRIGFRLGFISS